MKSSLQEALQQRPALHHLHTQLLRRAPDAVLIGGAVRDMLVGRTVQDLDYVITGDALAVGRHLADDLAAAYYALDEERGIARVIWQSPEGALVVDISSLSGLTLLEDIQRRDFTINAIAMLPYGDLYDPLGGVIDLEQGLLRPCSPDSLLNDPVRTIRAVRFLLDFHLRAAPGLDHLVWHAAPYLTRVSAERQRDEFLKTLMLDRPHLAVERLTDWRISDVLMPELVALQGVEQPAPHRYDVYRHTILTLRWMGWLDRWLRGETDANSVVEQHIAQRLEPLREELRGYLEARITGHRTRWVWLRFAALAHDWGKATAFREDEQGRITFYQHEQESARLVRAWMSRYHCSRQEITLVSRICEGHMRPMGLFINQTLPSRRALFRFYRDLQDAAVGTVLLFLADFLGARGERVEPDALDAALTHMLAWLQPGLGEATIVPAPLLKGDEVIRLLGLKPGPEIGRLLDALQEAQAAGEVTSREEAIAFLRRITAQARLEGASDE